MANRRTREEKLRALARRESPATVSYKLPATIGGQNYPSHVSVLPQFEYVKRDLMRTLVLAILAFSFELCLYWVFERGGI